MQPRASIREWRRRVLLVTAATAPAAASRQNKGIEKVLFFPTRGRILCPVVAGLLLLLLHTVKQIVVAVVTLFFEVCGVLRW